MNRVKSVIIRYSPAREIIISFCRTDGTGRAYNLGTPITPSSCKERTEALIEYLIDGGWYVDHHIREDGFSIYLENGTR